MEDLGTKNQPGQAAQLTTQKQRGKFYTRIRDVVVDEAIADAIGHGLVADEGVPVFWIELAGDDDGGRAVAIFENLAEFTSFAGFEGGAPRSSMMSTWALAMRWRTRE
jgi:hypothetical protein